MKGFTLVWLMISIFVDRTLSQVPSVGPTVTRTPSESFTQAQTFTFSISGKSSDSSYSAYGCQVDNAGRAPCSVTFEQTQPLSEGQHSFTAFFYNPTTKQYKDPTKVTWTIDKSPPNIQFIDPTFDGSKQKDINKAVSYRVTSSENMGTYVCVLMRLTSPAKNTSVLCSGKGTTGGSATLNNLMIPGQDILYKLVVTVSYQTV
ncbi:uncharacterized protein LOC134194269 [Corticium candelabrum]|uniref:uncharacterized protein LOC134194269 n=1 Tax=Corticium candelabrum TaxID=121492 RepID=UPI002E259773|nr:uncharacterized protein LOC134194269 [Corticium candelabrum]XP_062519178.1 uncharacterized protein LOC134194269 [Corticium candelabrum]